MRVDLLLVHLKLAATRTRAQEMIKCGQVFLIENEKKRRIEKSSEDVKETSLLEVTAGFATDYVSRAGHKIKGAVEALNIEIAGKNCLDVGVSTGGFSDFLLRAGAQKVVGIDVGKGQTDDSICTNPRFILFEKTNARSLTENSEFLKSCPTQGFDFICMDVSFISITLILSQLWPLLNPLGKLLVLVKPQFELGPDALDDGGIVKDVRLYNELEAKLKHFAKNLNFKFENYISSPIQGKDGNKEFFLFLSKNSG